MEQSPLLTAGQIPWTLLLPALVYTGAAIALLGDAVPLHRCIAGGLHEDHVLQAIV